MKITTTASTTSASTNTPILAIDLGKYKSVACVHNQATGEYGFTTFETTRAELRKLVGQEQPASAEVSPSLCLPAERNGRDSKGVEGYSSPAPGPGKGWGA
jgi:hypothetical protein